MKRNLIIIMSVVVLALFSFLFLAQSKTPETETTTKIYGLPSEKTIILRMDDIQGYAWGDIFTTLTDEVLNRNLSIVLGVIPFANIDNDTKVLNYLKSISKNPKIEIAMHGTFHTPEEYLNLNETENNFLAKKGVDQIYHLLGIHPLTFVPPNNDYNNNYTKTLSDLGIRYLSAGNRNSDFEPDVNLYRMGFSTTTKYFERSELNPVETILSECKEALDTRNFCVIMIHPQDYARNPATSIDEKKFKEFKRVLDNLHFLNATISTFISMNKV